MFEQYPHILSYALQGTLDQYDESNGQWIPGIPGEVAHLSCRAIPNNGPGQIVNERDGKSVHYDFTLAFPAGTPDLVPGIEVTVVGVAETVVVTGTLLRFQTGRMHKLGWI